ncbi:hypothetical protein LshimejAT787_0602720 [Lyophyllum shimeji]|uniref:F-box domain-containing protein n=1 Tax=Lyophyllum shimeji TaxID=47721 RepID=A0A9P3PNH2_LYOSH|nr:hypothetical protein LshimejAT787_0602720 [Lyophyllum shimeji]
MPVPTPTEPPRSILRRRQPPPITPLSLEISRRMPSEVFDIIIERIARFDVPTLRACSLVCKAWLPVSRHHLFPAISLGPKNAKRFLRLLDSPHCTISNGVHHVSIHGDSDAISHRASRGSRIYPPDTDVSLSAGGTPSSCDETLLRRLASFPLLTSLSFSWLRTGLTPSTTAALIHGFAGLTALELRTCTFPSFDKFTNMICALQNLRRIVLADVTWVDLALPESPTRQSLPPRLESLDLYLSPIGHVCTWLATRSDELENLSTINMCSAFWEDIDAISIAWMLRRLGPKIKHLGLPWHLPEIDLSHHTELRTLRISHLWFKPVLDSPAEECFTARGIEKTLLQLSSPQIRSIEIRVLTLFQLKSSELGFDWEKMKRILSRKCFAQLQVLTFGLPACDKRLKMMLRNVWGGAREATEDDDSRRHSRSSRRSGSRRLTRLQVDEVFAGKAKNETDSP